MEITIQEVLINRCKKQNEKLIKKDSYKIENTKIYGVQKVK